MLKRLFIFSGLYGVLSIYWIHSYDFHFFGLDELNVFVGFEKATDIEELIKFILAPHNRHFAPVFKALFYVEYVLFGASPAPYHAVSIGLFAISTMLLWRFLLEETGDRLTAFLCTAAYAANTTYFTVIAWVFIQQFILALIFIQLSLISVQKQGKGLRRFIASGAYCVLSSFCLAMGAAAWLFTSVYYALRQSFLPSAQRPDVRGLAFRLSPLGVSAAATLAAYLFFRENLSGSFTETLALDPVVLAKGIAVMAGNIMIKTLGLFHIVNLRVPIAVLMPVLRFVTITVFFLTALAAFLLLKKLSSEQRATALAGILLSWLASAMVIAASVGYFDIEVFGIIDYVRYNYFPFFFLLTGAAPYLAASKRQVKNTLLLLLPLWLVLHAFIGNDLFALNASRVNSIQSPLSFVEEAVRLNYPIVKDEKGDVKMVKVPMTKARPLKDITFFKQGSPTYRELLYLYKDPGDIVVEYPSMVLFLRRQLSIPAGIVGVSPQAAGKTSGGKLRLSSHSRIALSVRDVPVPNPSRFQHLSLRLKADEPVAGVLTCRSTKGKGEETRFDVYETIVHKLYVLPCPSGADISLSLDPGKYSIKDLKLHY